MNREILFALRLEAIRAGAKSEAQIRRYLSRTQASAQPSPNKPPPSTPPGTPTTAAPPIKSKTLSELVAQLNAIDAPTDRTIYWRSHEQEFKAAQWRELYGLTQGPKTDRRPRYGKFANNQNRK